MTDEMSIYLSIYLSILPVLEDKTLFPLPDERDDIRRLVGRSVGYV